MCQLLWFTSWRISTLVAFFLDQGLPKILLKRFFTLFGNLPWLTGITKYILSTPWEPTMCRLTHSTSEKKWICFKNMVFLSPLSGRENTTNGYNARQSVCLAAQSCPTLCDPIDCSPPGSFVQGILQARILDRVAMPSSRGSPQPRDQTQVSHIVGGSFNIWATREAQDRKGHVPQEKDRKQIPRRDSWLPPDCLRNIFGGCGTWVVYQVGWRLDLKKWENYSERSHWRKWGWLNP